MVTPDNTARRISMVEEIIRRSGAQSKPSRRGTARANQQGSEQIASIKTLIRKIHQELVEAGTKGDLHEQICERLHNHPRPPGAKWKDLPWPKAYASLRYQRSVRAWISKAIHSTD